MQIPTHHKLHFLFQHKNEQKNRSRKPPNRHSKTKRLSSSRLKTSRSKIRRSPNQSLMAFNRSHNKNLNIQFKVIPTSSSSRTSNKIIRPRSSYPIQIPSFQTRKLRNWDAQLAITFNSTQFENPPSSSS